MEVERMTSGLLDFRFAKEATRSVRLSEAPLAGRSPATAAVPRGGEGSCTACDEDSWIERDGPLDLSRALRPSSPATKTACHNQKVVGGAAEESHRGVQVPPDSTCSRAPAQGTTRRQNKRALLPCEVCGKTFDRPSLLKRHARTHTGEKPHACQVCGKCFSTSSSLNTHRRIHSGEKPHACLVCGKRFTASSNLYYHRMTHTKEKPHKCSLCGKSFPTPGDLRSHAYVHSGCWPFRCPVCNRGFSKHTNLRNHLFLHTGDKPHGCRVCGKRFALSCNLRAHVRIHQEATASLREGAEEKGDEHSEEGTEPGSVLPSSRPFHSGSPRPPAASTSAYHPAPQPRRTIVRPSADHLLRLFDLQVAAMAWKLPDPRLLAGALLFPPCPFLFGGYRRQPEREAVFDRGDGDHYGHLAQ